MEILTEGIQVTKSIKDVKSSDARFYKFIDITRLLTDRTLRIEEEDCLTSTEEKDTRNDNSRTGENDVLDELFDLIEGEIRGDENEERKEQVLSNDDNEKIRGRRRPLLMIDDLSTICWFGIDLVKIDLFLKRIEKLQRQYQFSLVTVFHTDCLDSTRKLSSKNFPNQPRAMNDCYKKFEHDLEVDKDRVLLDILVRKSDLILRTRTLGSLGLGELEIIRGPNLMTLSPHIPFTLSLNSTIQYRIDDNRVTYYPKGLDKGFI
ncbi:hypothetical protein BY996DRAFT_6413173 [Phakopsora pachyrhizi]|nr:hypothetical protein BY996DRAFT_6413173 [Phakopsora pachyrhizi]